MSIAERLQGKGPKRSGGKQVRLRLVWIDFWSALKLSAIVGVIAGIVLLVVSFVLWSLLNLLGLFGRIDETLSDILGESFTVMDYLSLPQVLLFTVIVALLNFVVITVLGAVFATLYNLSVRFTGGLLVGYANQ
ncbi:DUF3566 domain-containing protein [Agrococcus sp. SGAir0287]|uniref:DUF3566 domain-containing protein n=1 Tax=Agrococcus sp. SGAir0287 TaxID=2070347 RepID=UPI0010CCEC1D|nr:DUF3566 domain-containing protein [Agrococcus sp. SGAir0287]QCR18035.1 hypothetical protein C1N71_00045 [Agrococcus sp. SGAir0287]